MKYLFWIISFVLISFPSWAKDYNYPYDSLSERDPLRPLINEQGEILIREKKEMSDFLLQGIMYSEEGSTVIINNELFQEGDTFDGYKIKKIHPYRIILEKGNQEFILKWEGHDEN